MPLYNNDPIVRTMRVPHVKRGSEQCRVKKSSLMLTMGSKNAEKKIKMFGKGKNVEILEKI
jgi:hypothetical protein